ncbi:serine/threonine-protein kinase [Kitasatospora sp. NPDC052896]|uniref:serine/threonine-protein kinase n=1 Tax=Kitasatospora sp. NPDC052896 TaxID=3364061 RepID=UPI0037C756C4
MSGRDQEVRMLAGRYELGDRLGRGGMGTVWRARDLMLDREVAVKELTVNHLPEEDLAILQSRMKQEARAAARIKHPGVITIHDVLEQDGRPWIVMELVDGRSLADVISQDGPLNAREAAGIGAQVLAALHRGHQLGVLHRDVKPANVLLERGTGRVVLLDFGIAKFEGDSELTRPGDLVGSPDYLAPERAQGERPGPASDLWGLGATLYAVVEGQSPFRRDTPLSTLAAVVDEPLPEPRRAGALGPVLAALMAKEPGDRPEADEALRMLQEVMAGHTIGMAQAPRQAQQVHRTPTQAVPVVDRQEPEPEPGPGPQPEYLSEFQSESQPESQPEFAAEEQHQPTGPTELRSPEQPAPTPTPTPPAPAPRRRRSRVRIALVVLTVLVIGGAGALVALHQLGRTTSTGSATPGTPSPSPSTSASLVPDDASASPLAPGSVLPGYQWTQDPAGFGFQLPTAIGTWQRTTDSSNQIYYSPDNQRHVLQFAVNVGQSLSPLDHLTQLEVDVRKKLKAYQRITLAANKVRGLQGARWEFTYSSVNPTNPGPRHVIEEEYMDADGTSYAILMSCPDNPSDWTLTQQWFTAVLNNFTPTS